jgi:hypothetical protein
VTTPRATAPWVLTASGRRFDLLAPRAADVDAQDVAHALARLGRFGGHARALWSVAQHSVLVSRLVPRRLALAGLLHDAAEAYVGDMTAPVRSLVPGHARLEARVLRAVAARFGVPLAAFDDPLVREADARARLAERDALLPPSPIPWAEDLAGLRPARVAIVPLPPPRAEAAFLARLRGLAPGPLPLAGRPR